jgi:mannose-6-phosphate isomerase-like protein (cupin superfamily)
MPRIDIDPVTEEEKKLWPRSSLVPLARPFVDVRGLIQPLVDMKMKSAVLIESKKDSLRANHYHLTDWHFCYVLSGRMEYHYRPHGSAAKPSRVIVEEGQMVFTPPMEDHAMTFSVDTVFLTLSRNPRDQATYEADVRRIELVSGEGFKSWKPGD